MLCNSLPMNSKPIKSGYEGGCNDGYALEFAAEELKADKEVVMAAVSNDEDTLEFVSDELKEKL